MSWRRFWSPEEGPNMLYTIRRQIYSSFRIYRVAILYPTRERAKRDNIKCGMLIIFVLFVKKNHYTLWLLMHLSSHSVVIPNENLTYYIPINAKFILLFEYQT